MDVQAVAPEAASARPPVVRRQTVLMVDDEKDILDAVKVSIETFLKDVDVVVHASGGEALAWLRAHPADLILSDYKMPAMDGLEFLRAAQKLQPQVPRILVTAYPDLMVAMRAIQEAHIENFVTKPFDLRHFVAVVGSVVYERRAQEFRAQALARSLELFGNRAPS